MGVRFRPVYTNVRDIRIHCFDADKQLSANLLVSRAFRDEPENFRLAWGETVGQFLSFAVIRNPIQRLSDSFL